MKKFEIGYVTEDPGKEYAKAIRKAQTLSELIAAIGYYGECAEDAYQCAVNLSDEDFVDFRKEIGEAHKKKSEAWTMRFVERFGPISMPMKMFFASMVADQFHAPWGTAYIRCKEEGWRMLKK
jgi:hypothetical protein